MTRRRIDPSSRLPIGDDGATDSATEEAPVLEIVEPTAMPVPLPKAPFVELFARSNFSFLHGATAPEKLVFAARACGYESLGICDLDGFYGSVRALEQGDRDGVRLVLGCELSV